MAPGRPLPRRRSSSNPIRRAPHNGQDRSRRLQQPEQDRPDFSGLPEYLYQAYERLPNFDTASSHPLLIDARSGRSITYSQFRALASVLAASMSHRLGVTSSNTVVIYSTPNIDTPVVAVAAWLLGVSVVAWAPEQSTDELACFGALIALPQAFFTTQALLPALMRLLGRLGASASQRPIVLLTDSGGRNAARPENALSIQELYTPRPGETPFERTPLTQNQAQLYTAVIYFTISRSYEGSLVAGTPVHMDHANAISNYLELLRPTSLVPHAAAAATANVSLEPERQTRMPPRPAHEEQSPAQARSGYHIAYSILRLNHSFLLHRIVCDIFCRGGAYLVARSFDPAEFVDLVGRYRLKFAELTHADVLQLIDYLNYPNPPYRQSPSSASGNNRVATALAPLRYICTDSREMEAELSPILRTLLPNVEIVCTRFGAYLDLPDQTRR